TEQQPQNTEQQPQNTEQQPQNTEQQPQNTEQQPQNTEQQPQQQIPSNVDSSNTKKIHEDQSENNVSDNLTNTDQNEKKQEE
ncbi:MAG: hypothetical protein ABJB76_12130, partial [Candidatus Nitrosocosmicus sp.]